MLEEEEVIQQNTSVFLHIYSLTVTPTHAQRQRDGERPPHFPVML